MTFRPRSATQLGIEVVPLTIRFGDREYVDRKELTTDAFWKQLETASVLPETAAPSVGAFEEAFRALHDDGADGIVCVNLSAHLSATMQSAQVAAKALDGLCPIEVIDSATASMGIGILALHAARRVGRRRRRRDDRARGHRSPRPADDSSRRSTRSSTSSKGGRIGGAQAMLGSMLSIKPIITVDRRRGRGGRQGAHPLEGAAVHASTRSPRATSSRSACCTPAAADLDEFIELVQPKVPGAEIVVGHIGPVVGVHVGPGAIGLTWIERAGLTVDSLPFVGEGRRSATTNSPPRPRTAIAMRSTRCCAGTRAWCTRSAGACSANPEDALDATQEALHRDRPQDRHLRRPLAVHDLVLPRRHQRRARRSPAPRPAAGAGRDRARAAQRTGQSIDDASPTSSTSTPRWPQLSPDHRAAVALRDLVGLDYAEIGEVLGIPPGTVRSRIARGRAALADHLGDRARSHGNQTPRFGTSNLESTMNDPDHP